MPTVAFDTETFLIEPGILAPKLVCGSWSDGTHEEITTPQETIDRLKNILYNTDLHIVGATICYDMAVCMAADFKLAPLIFAAYGEGRIHDVQIRQALDAIAGGHLFLDPRNMGGLKDPESGKQTNRYSLAVCCDLVLGRKIAKADTWRLRYHELDGIPLEKWPVEAIQYPKDDARNAWDVWLAQEGFRNLHDEPRQTRADFALHLACVRGIRTDPERVKAITERVEDQRALDRATFTAAGFYRAGINPDTGKPWPKAKMGTKDTEKIKALVTEAYGWIPCPFCKGKGKIFSLTGMQRQDLEQQIEERLAQIDSDDGPLLYIERLEIEKEYVKDIPPEKCADCRGTGKQSNAPTTPGGGVSTDRDTLAESGNELLEAFAKASENEKIFTTYLEVLEAGTKTGINPMANVLVETGRASYSKPNLQNIPREGGVRECFVARPGYVFAFIDYSTLELRTLAQCCLWLFGYSDMAEALKRGEDLHTALAATLINVPYADLLARVKAGDKDAKAKRQLAKVGNFGFPGGMGVAKLVASARKVGDKLCLLAGAATKCDVEKTREYNHRAISPTCLKCLEVAENLKKAWLAQWSEMREYFALIARETADEVNGGTIEQMLSKRIRGGLGYCDGANTRFQGLAADMAKDAFWRITKECYVVRSSPLYGSRPVLFIHDENGLEVKEGMSSAAAKRAVEIMAETAAYWLPDIPVGELEPVLMRFWSKEAKSLYDSAGTLLAWEPVDKPIG